MCMSCRINYNIVGLYIVDLGFGLENFDLRYFCYIIKRLGAKTFGRFVKLLGLFLDFNIYGHEFVHFERF